MKTRLFLSMAALIALTVIASAQTTNQTTAPAGQGRGQGTAWVDANNDGVCDNFEKGPRMGQGQRNGRGQAQGIGQGQGYGQGRGPGKGQGRRDGQGPNFVDANKDGICDYRVAQAPR
jgi:hypothetical protein